MDPNANNRDQVFLAERFLEDDEIDEDDARQLAELVLALDEWLNKGGFLPQDWLKASEEDLFTAIHRILAANESRCCDNEDDRQVLALALSMGLQKRD